jgi:hypothetical protein
MFLETSPGSTGDLSYLTSPSFTGKSSLTFYYHMYGSAMGTLSVQALAHGSWSTMWSISGQQQNSQSAAWLSHTNSLSSDITQVRFSGEKGSSNYYGDMAVDNIAIT